MFLFATLRGLEELLEDNLQPGSAVSINCLSHHSVNAHLVVPFAYSCNFLVQSLRT